MIMTTEMVITLLVIAVVALIGIVVSLLLHARRQERELKQKNEVIIREIYHSQNIIERAVKHGVSRAALLSTLLLLSVAGYGQNGCFEYEDEGKTIISRLSNAGATATELTIPAKVTTVRSGALANASSSLTELTVEDGGNPAFESGLFGSEKSNTLTSINLGDGISVANMIALLTSLGTFQEGTTIVASGFSGDKDTSDGTWGAVTWDNVSSITLPAELVADQTFGTATVYGRFTISKEIISFCTSATFLDKDDGSNMLFYVADYRAEDGRLHIQRVKYIAAGKGVLIHRLDSSSGSCDLVRSGDINDNTEQAKTDKALYKSNMLVGVTSATAISATEGNKTNYVLKDGAFHPTSGGNIKANRAYLQIPTAAARGVSLEISFDEEETGIGPTPSPSLNGGEWYDLQGRRLNAKPINKGLYINNSKKYLNR